MAQYYTPSLRRPQHHGSFILWIDRAIAWCRQEWRLLSSGVAIVVLLLGAAIGWSVHSAHQEEQAAALLYRASGSAGESANTFAQLITQYPHTVAATVAQLTLSEQALQKGQWEEVVNRLKPVVEGKGVHGMFRAMALESLAYGYESGKDYQAATRTFQQLLHEPAAVDRFGALRGMVRCLVAAGQVVEAKQALQDFSDAGFGNEGEGDFRQTELLWLSHLASQK